MICPLVDTQLHIIERTDISFFIQQNTRAEIILSPAVSSQ